MDDAAIHRVSGVANRQCGSFIENQWIATGYALAMTRVMVSPSFFTLHPSLFRHWLFWKPTRKPKL